jgi:hypothetical protein
MTEQSTTGNPPASNLPTTRRAPVVGTVKIALAATWKPHVAPVAVTLVPPRKTVALPSFWSRCCHLAESCDTLVTPSESSNTLATQSQQGLCS